MRDSRKDLQALSLILAIHQPRRLYLEMKLVIAVLLCLHCRLACCSKAKSTQTPSASSFEFPAKKFLNFKEAVDPITKKLRSGIQQCRLKTLSPVLSVFDKVMEKFESFSCNFHDLREHVAQLPPSADSPLQLPYMEAIALSQFWANFIEFQHKMLLEIISVQLKKHKANHNETIYCLNIWRCNQYQLTGSLHSFFRCYEGVLNEKLSLMLENLIWQGEELGCLVWWFASSFFSVLYDVAPSYCSKPDIAYGYFDILSFSGRPLCPNFSISTAGLASDLAASIKTQVSEHADFKLFTTVFFDIVKTHLGKADVNSPLVFEHLFADALHHKNDVSGCVNQLILLYHVAKFLEDDVFIIHISSSSIESPDSKAKEGDPEEKAEDLPSLIQTAADKNATKDKNLESSRTQIEEVQGDSMANSSNFIEEKNSYEDFKENLVVKADSMEEVQMVTQSASTSNVIGGSFCDTLPANSNQPDCIKTKECSKGARAKVDDFLKGHRSYNKLGLFSKDIEKAQRYSKHDIAVANFFLGKSNRVSVENVRHFFSNPIFGFTLENLLGCLKIKFGDRMMSYHKPHPEKEGERVQLDKQGKRQLRKFTLLLQATDYWEYILEAAQQ